MSKEQIAWTQKQCEQVKNFIKTNHPLTEQQWDNVADYIASISAKAKGSIEDFSAEVRSMLFDAVDAVSKEMAA